MRAKRRIFIFRLRHDPHPENVIFFTIPIVKIVDFNRSEIMDFGSKVPTSEWARIKILMMIVIDKFDDCVTVDIGRNMKNKNLQ